MGALWGDEATVIRREGRMEQLCLFTAQNTGWAIAVYRVTLVEEKAVELPPCQIRSSSDIVPLARYFLGGLDREHFMVFLLALITLSAK